MAKILLHIGLPKTATTTLQNIFFTRLHQEKKINYLGKIELTKAKIRNKEQRKYHSIYQKIIAPCLRFGVNFTENLAEYKKLLNSILDESKINVISDENLFFSFQNKFHYNQIFDEKIIQRHKLLFAGHSIQILCVFRKQTDWLYSWYTFHYAYHWFYIKNNDTIKRYYKDLILQFQKKTKTLYYADIMEELQKTFSSVSCLFYEELLMDKNSYYQKIAGLLGIKITTVNLPNEYLNVSNKTLIGVYVQPIKPPAGAVLHGKIHHVNCRFLLYQKLRKYFAYFSKIVVHYNIFLSTRQKERIHGKILALPLILISFFYFSKIHPFFTKEQKKTIMDLCRVNNKKLFLKKFCSLQDLKKYGYF